VGKILAEGWGVNGDSKYLGRARVDGRELDINDKELFHFNAYYIADTQISCLCIELYM
jgi:hypothetical protein